MTMRHIAEPFTYGDALYRTGISVGDYPIDHHHKKNLEAPQHLEFYPIPSYNIPLGALIPQTIDNLIIAEKAISVSNIVNGTTRLQPCVLLTGQAAGILAALASKQNLSPKKIPVRSVQNELLKAKAYIMPYIDVKPDNPHWEAVQKIGATGILKGTGNPNNWANQTWFYPDSLVNIKEFAKGYEDYYYERMSIREEQIKIGHAVSLAVLQATMLEQKGKKTALSPLKKTEDIKELWVKWGLKNFDSERPITRLELAVLFHNIADPFSMKTINHKGAFAK
jgi:hypothetical protein